MQQESITEVEYASLSKDQLVAMVAARGDALIALIEADKVLRQKIDAGKLAFDDMVRMEKTKEAALLKLGELETAIIFGQVVGGAAN